jgi:glycosyltransferase involved in cell wall biosynthesis
VPLTRGSRSAIRVAVFTDNDFAKVNGVTTTLRALLQRTPSDLSVRIYTADGRGADEPDYLSLRAFGFGIPFYREMKVYFPPFWSYVRRARRDGIDLIHMTTPGPVGIAAIFTAWWLRIPLVGSFHTDLAKYATLLSRSRGLGFLVGRYLRRTYGQCQRILVPSEATSAMLRSAGIGAAAHIVWRRGVDTDLFSPARRSPALRERWGAGADTAVVMYLGRVSREKNLAAFLTVHEQLVALGRPFRLVFVGDGPMRAEIERRLPDAIVTGSIPHAQVGEYLASADVFAFPSRTDTAGNAVLEAQASGLPAVIGDEGGPRENVLADRTALVTDACDDRAFAEAVARLVRDRSLAADMGTAARAFALTRDWPSALEPLFATYRELIPPPTPAPALALTPACPSDYTS